MIWEALKIIVCNNAHTISFVFKMAYIRYFSNFVLQNLFLAILKAIINIKSFLISNNLVSELAT